MKNLWEHCVYYIVQSASFDDDYSRRPHRTFCGSVYHMIQDESAKDSETVQIKTTDHIALQEGFNFTACEHTNKIPYILNSVKRKKKRLNQEVTTLKRLWHEDTLLF